MSYIKVSESISKQVYLLYRQVLQLHHKKLEFYLIHNANKVIRQEIRRHFDAANDEELDQFTDKLRGYLSNLQQEYGEKPTPPKEEVSEIDYSFYEFLQRNPLNVMDVDASAEKKEELFNERVKNKFEKQQNEDFSKDLDGDIL
ncbi:unnamed protein product [Moneuplotes crassus]|uniref:Uncharacterized protein n=1 Tax=Euplotes crassus TaxID=5936 RepID=A0AAD1Y1D5_EUPCR|nr:unnamed protein product [Moneuplotes crassus]